MCLRFLIKAAGRKEVLSWQTFPPLLYYSCQEGGRLFPERGVIPMTVLEVLALLNLLAVVIFETLQISRKKK